MAPVRFAFDAAWVIGMVNINVKKAKMKVSPYAKLFAASVLAGGLSLTASAQIGSGWSSVSESFKVQLSGSGWNTGNQFGITKTTDPTDTIKDRAEREYSTWTSGNHQFQGDCTINSFTGNGICVKQTFQKVNGPWEMVAINNGGSVYEVHNNTTLGSFKVGTSFRINTILSASSSSTVQVYFNGSLKTTITGGVEPIYDKCGTYRLKSGSAAVTATWNNVKFWQK